jgi:uncharacterized protein (DUF736 family)
MRRGPRMPTKYNDDMRGALFPNAKKDRENSPDYRGECEVAGIKYWLSGWKSVSKGGAPFMSLSFRAKESKSEEKRMRTQLQIPTDAQKPDFDDDIPF